MGVFLSLDIVPQRISKEEWALAYQETLTLLKNFQFLGLVEDDGHYYAARSVHQENLWGGEAGWRVDGDMHNGANMEEFFLFSNITHYQERTQKCPLSDCDILLSRVEGIKGLPSIRIWDSKTQGQPAHLHLLAIGCLLCHRFPNAALVSGDITAEQCRQAVKWANQFLTEPIDVPVTADANRLLPRLQAIGLEGDKLLRSFYEITLESPCKKVGDILCNHLPMHVIENYYKKQFLPNQERKPDAIYLNFRDAKNYLAQGFSLEVLCRAVMVDPDGNRLAPREFMKSLLEMKLHIPLEEKVLYDFTVSPRTRGSAEVDSVNRMLFQVWCIMHGAGNLNVAAYCPLEEICSVFEATLGAGEYIVMAKALLEEIQGSDKNEKQALLYDGPDSYYKRLIELQENEETKAVKREYNIEGTDDIIEYRPGDTVQPDLHAVLITFVKQIREIGESVFTDMLKGRDSETRESFFYNNYRTLIPKAVKDAIYAQIMDDEYIIRYVSLYSIQADENNKWAIRGMLWNPDLLDCVRVGRK